MKTKLREGFKKYKIDPKECGHKGFVDCPLRKLADAIGRREDEAIIYFLASREIIDFDASSSFDKRMRWVKFTSTWDQGRKQADKRKLFEEALTTYEASFE